MNGKEFPKNSFEKFTAHRFRNKLRAENPDLLERFKVTACDRNYNFWQRDPLAIRIYSREIAVEKLDYMHYNPLQEHWKLSDLPENYKFSSAAFYESGNDEFNIVTHYLEGL